MKKRPFVLIALLAAVCLLAGCKQESPAPMRAEFDALVLTKTESTLLLDQDGLIYCGRGNTPDEAWADILPGDVVTVDCKNEILECYPAQVAETYSVSLKAEGDMRGLPRILRVEGALYADTGMTDAAPGCGLSDGNITACVSEQQYPTANDSSNFGTGYAYQFAADGSLRVCIDGEWKIFTPILLRDDLAWHLGLTDER